MAACLDLAGGGAAPERLDPGTAIASLSLSLAVEVAPPAVGGSLSEPTTAAAGGVYWAAHPLPDGDGAEGSASSQEGEEDCG
ncbi:unnamed protein product [Urochloa humidicola]